MANDGPMRRRRTNIKAHHVKAGNSGKEYIVKKCVDIKGGF